MGITQPKIFLCILDFCGFLTPLSSQMCTVEVESFGYTMSDLKYRWQYGNDSVQMSPDVQLPQFIVLGHRQRFIEVSLTSGNYSRLLADVQFIRSMGYYMIQVSELEFIFSLNQPRYFLGLRLVTVHPFIIF